MGVLLAGCSPTYQSLYEGDVRFEHCYRVDEERQIPISDKLTCWRDWDRRYRHGQSRDRIEYARARERTLAQALAAGQPAAPRGATGVPPCALPQPTSAFAPPPPTMTPANAGADVQAGNESGRALRELGAGDAGARIAASLSLGETSSALVEDAPGATCAVGCGKTWSNCKQPCKVAPCRAACDDK